MTTATRNHECPKHGTAHSVLLIPGTPEQAFCGESYGCALCPAGGSTLYPSEGLETQLSAMKAKAAETTKFIIVKQNGQQHKPNRRGYTDFTYPSEYAAQAAINAMPARARAGMTVKPVA
jgi:hypothetical protein